MKYLFIFPSIGFYLSRYIRGASAFLPPLGVLYLARMVELHGHSAEIIDYNAEKFEDNAFERAVKSADVVGLTIYSDQKEFENSITLTKKIKQISPDMPIIIGGPHCTLFPEQTLISHNADICVKGEGELIIGPITDALEGKRELSSIPGLTYLQNGKIHTTKPNEQIENLDVIPFPARHLVEKYEYGHMLGMKTMKGKATSLISSRGCPNRCTFCQLTCFSEYRRRSVTNTTQEIDELVNAGYNSIAFADDNFLADKKRVEQIMDHILKQRYDLSFWIIDARVDSADRKLYQKLRDAGVELISFGIESGNQEILDYYNKKITLQQVRNAIKLSKEMGFMIDANFILGAPNETKKQINNTIKFAKSLDIDHAVFNHFEYTAGSSIWKQAVSEGKLSPEETSVKSCKKRDLALYTSEEIDKLCNKANFSFYTNPMYWIRQFNFALRNNNPTIIRLALRKIKNII